MKVKSISSMDTQPPNFLLFHIMNTPLPSKNQQCQNGPHDKIIYSLSCTPHFAEVSSIITLFGKWPQLVTYEELGIFSQRPKRPDMAVTQVRINTFEGWPHNESHPREEMAEAGFYYTGMEISVCCFGVTECGKNPTADLRRLWWWSVLLFTGRTDLVLAFCGIRVMERGTAGLGWLMMVLCYFIHRARNLSVVFWRKKNFRF